jgi:phytanoyl-CoA hydroxylase
MDKLSSQQVADYRRDGFLVLKDFVSAEACDELRARALEMVTGFDPQGVVSIFSTRGQTRTSDRYFMESGDRISFFFEEDAFDAEGRLRRNKERSINKIGHALHDLDPVFARFSRTTELAQLVSDLQVARPLLVQSMYIFKQPGIGGEVTCHQDSTFLYTEPPTVVGLWFALEDATRENGCLWAMRGGHMGGLKSRFVRAPEGGTKFVVLDEATRAQAGELVPLEVAKGTLIVLDGMLPHLSEANRSEKSRHAYTLHAIAGDSLYPPDNWLQRGPHLPFRGF